ncbi:head-tail connector protein [Microbispora bryophytorum]|uniref:head-tail connector protein n=1 Tax=Microbispora bryophytorum TaxID=1460882 RepID=UPI0033E6BBC2
MALGDPYATLDELKSYLSIDDEIDDAEITSALASASREIDRYCDRQFNKSETATTRIFRPKSNLIASVDDFWTTDGLIIKTDPNNDGTYSTTWTASDYELAPLNGVVDGELGWPYFKIRVVSMGIGFPMSSRASLQVTAQWGWGESPAPVTQACLIIASETFKVKTAPFGVAGYDQWGPVRVKNSPIAMRMLAPYRRFPFKVG